LDGNIALSSVESGEGQGEAVVILGNFGFGEWMARAIGSQRESGVELQMRRSGLIPQIDIPRHETTVVAI
jgi:hypothetical protein